MNTKTNKVTLVPASKKNNKVALNASTVPITKTPLQLFQESGIGDRMRRQYGQTFYADPIAQTGDAVCTLSDGYLMKIFEDIRAANPGANDERMWTENGDGNGVGLLVAAMAQAEADPQLQETSASEIAASDIRSAAHAAALVLASDVVYGDIQRAIVAAERTRRQAPAELAWTLDRLYVKRDATGKILHNAIEEGTEDGKFPAWPIIGTKEKDDRGNIINNPDIMMKYPRGSNKAVPVSFYGEMIRDTPVGKAMIEDKEQYNLAAAKVPTGKYSDKTSTLYVDEPTALKRVEEIQNDIDTMVKSLKKATHLLRHMWAVNEMAAPNAPPRLAASFRTERVWNPNKVSPEGHKGGWDEDATKLARMDSPILVHDKVSNETAMFKIGEFLSHDPIAAGKAGGTISDFRKAVSKTKRAPGNGTGQTATTAQSNRVVLSNADLDKYIAAVATSFETPAALANYQRFLNGKPEESDGSLLSLWHWYVQVQAMFATQADLRKRIVILDKSTPEAVDDLSGLGREIVKKKVA